MHGAAGLRLTGVHQHIDPGRVAVREAERPDSVDDRLQLGPVHRDVHVARRARGARVALGDMEKHRHTADHAIVEAGLGERLHQATDGVEELFHVAIVRGDGQHGIRRDYLI